MAFYSGLDLGLVADFSALAVLDRQPAALPVPKRRWRYDLRWLEAWDLGTPYTTICAGVAARFRSDSLRYTPLAVDYTGVGMAVVEQLKAARVQGRLRPVVITAGHKVTTDDEHGSIHVPKKELVTNLMTLLQAGLLKWDATRLPLAKRLEKELAAFQIKVTKAKNETFGADASQHDDLVLAVMLAAWLGENTGGGDIAGISLPEPGAGSVLEAAPGGVFDTDPAYHRGSGFDDRR